VTALLADGPTARAAGAVPVALELVDAVRRWDRRDVEHVLKTADLTAVAVVLAAMVDDGRTVEEMLGWVAQFPVECDGWTYAELLDAHAQHEAHRVRGLDSPGHVREGERVYQRLRARRRRASA
jgi:hypothetical protein